MSASPSAVLVATAVVASPVALLLQRGLITLDDALLRAGICLALCWVALSVVGSLVSGSGSARAAAPTAAPVVVPAEATEPVAEAPSDVR